MLIGFNNDVEYRELVFHIQTEDHGERDGNISTMIFHKGQIIDLKKVPYSDLIDSHEDTEEREHAIRKRMVGMHRQLYKRLFSGLYDQVVGLEPSIEEIDVSSEDFEPKQTPGPDEGFKPSTLLDHLQSVNLETLQELPIEDIDLDDLDDLDGDESEIPLEDMDIEIMPLEEQSFSSSVPPLPITRTEEDIVIQFSNERKAYKGLREPTYDVGLDELVLEYLLSIA